VGGGSFGGVFGEETSLSVLMVPSWPDVVLLGESVSETVGANSFARIGVEMCE
jgi:hypothetical protein